MDRGPRRSRRRDGSAYSVSVFGRWTEDAVSVIRKTRLDADAEPDLPEEWRGGSRLAGADDHRRRQLDRAGRGARRPGCTASRTSGSTRHRRSATRSRPSTSCHGSTGRQRFARSAAWVELIDPHLVVTELRTMAPDGLWLSGAVRPPDARHPLHLAIASGCRRGAAARHRVGARTVRGSPALGQMAPVRCGAPGRGASPAQRFP